MTPTALQATLEAARRRLRADGAVAVALAAVGVVPAAMLLVWALGDWTPRSSLPLVVVLAAALAVVGVAVGLGRRWVGRLDTAAVAAAAERALGLPEGRIRGVVELRREGRGNGSEALLARAETQIASRLADLSPASLSGDLGRRTRQRRGRLLGLVLLLVAATVLAGFVTPDRARSAWTPLLRPLDHLHGPVLPAVVVRPGDAEVDRGSRVTVEVQAPLRTLARLEWRSAGERPAGRTLRLDGGRATAVLGPVDAPITYRVVTEDGLASDSFRLTPRDPLLLADLELEVRYPPHLQREPETRVGEPGRLELPLGSRLAFRGRATRRLTAASLIGARGGPEDGVVEDSSFRLVWQPGPDATGPWSWTLEGEDGRRVEGAAPLDLVVLRDEPPVVRITYPGVDTLLPPSRQQAVAAEAEDDHGLAAAQLVFRPVDTDGRGGEAVRVPLASTAMDLRARLRGLLDASALPLPPGGVVEYHVEVRDDSPAGQKGRSRTYRLRVPGRAEQRAQLGAEAASMLEALSALAARARSLAASTRQLGGETARSRGGAGGSSPGGGESSERLEYDAAAEATELADQQEALGEEAAALRERLASLGRALEQAALRDPQLRRRLDAIRELLERAESETLRERAAAVRDAVEALDPGALAEALERLAEAQEELDDPLERSTELMQRAVAEQELGALAQEAAELAARQEALAEALEALERSSGDEKAEGAEASEPAPSGDREPGATAEADPAADPAGESRPDSMPPPLGLPTPPRPSLPKVEARVAQQEELEARARRLGQSLESLERLLSQVGETQSSSSAGQARERGEASQQSMRDAADQGREGRTGEAAASGRQAAGQMAEAARTLQGAREAMGEAQREAGSQGMRQATQEALRLAREQEALRRQMEAAGPAGARGGAGAELRAAQSTVSEGVRQLGRALSEAMSRAARMDAGVGAALERAQLNADRTLSELEQGRAPASLAGRSVESLNQLALTLMQRESGGQGGGGDGLQQALERLGELAREQGALNGRLGAVAPLELPRDARTQQLDDAARQQRGVGRRIGSISDMLGGREDVLGQLDLLSTEAERIARELEGGRLDARVRARQERLFHRLLDAGRSLEREETSDERVGRRAAATEDSSPAALDPSLLDGAPRYSPPTAEQLARLPPAYRALVLRYFDRLNRGAGADDGGER